MSCELWKWLDVSIRIAQSIVGYNRITAGGSVVYRSGDLLTLPQVKLADLLYTRANRLTLNVAKAST